MTKPDGLMPPKEAGLVGRFGPRTPVATQWCVKCIRQWPHETFEGNSIVPHVDTMAADLRASVKELIASPVKRDVPSLVRGVQRELEHPAGNLMGRVAPILGFVGQEGKPFGDFAQVSTVLDALPRAITDKLLVEFMNDLYV